MAASLTVSRLPSTLTAPTAATPPLPRTNLARLLRAGGRPRRRRRRPATLSFVPSLPPPVSSPPPRRAPASPDAAAKHAPPPPPPPPRPAALRAPPAVRRAAVHFLSGGLAAGLVRASLQPLDTAKTRLQAARGAARAATASAAATSPGARLARVRATVLAGRGLRGLYKGVVPGVAGIIPAAAVYMLVYQSLRARFVRRTGRRWRSVGVAAAAALGDVAASLVRVPCEVAKQRLQVGVYTDARHALRAMARVRGVAGMYAGLGAQLARDVPFAAAEFVVYDLLKAAALRRGPPPAPPPAPGAAPADDRRLTRVESLAVGGASGIVAAIVSNPSDVAKTRLMTQTAVGAARRYTGVADAFRKIAAEEGVLAFSKGLAPRVAAKAIQSACFFATYETFKRLFAAALAVDMARKGAAPAGAH